MPLYLEDLPAGAWPDRGPFEALAIPMATAVLDRVVNPAVALTLLREFLAPLLPTEHADLLNVDGRPTWASVHFLYPALAFASGEGQDADLVAAARIVDIVVRHTTRPPREISGPAFVEVESFRRVCGYLGVPYVPPMARFQSRLVDLHAFCKYCWLPALGHGVCHLHSSNAGLAGQRELDGHPACAAAGPKAAQRLRKSFDATVLALATREEVAFHDADFVEPILAPPVNLRGWLAERRPATFYRLGPARTVPDTQALPDLLRLLYGDLAPAVAQVLGGSVIYLTPITIRAEAWLFSWANRPRWGGVRRR